MQRIRGAVREGRRNAASLEEPQLAEAAPFRAAVNEMVWIYRARITEAHDEMPDAGIFIHVHPFRINELPGIRSIGISDDGDRLTALRFNALVVSVARPEPYTGRGVYVDYTDDFYDPR